MPPPPKSSIWAYFKPDEHDHEKSRCKLCNKTYSRKGRTTTSLRNHLTSIHPEQFSASQKEDNEKELQKKRDE